MSDSHRDSYLSPRFSTGGPARDPGAPSEPPNRQSSSAITGSAAPSTVNPDISSPDAGPPTDRPRADAPTAHETVAWAQEHLHHPDGTPVVFDAGGAPFDPVAWERAWEGYALRPRDGQTPTLVLVDECANPGGGWLTEEQALAALPAPADDPDAVCGHQVGRWWPEGVPCAGCLATQLPARLRAAAAEDLADGGPGRGHMRRRAADFLTGVEAFVGKPLPSAARLAPLPWLTNDLGFPIVTAATLVDSVAEALEGDRADDARARARLVLDDEQDVERLVDLILGAAAFVAAKAAA